MINVQTTTQTTLVIGREGENKAKKFEFDYSDWITEFGEGEIVLKVLRPTDSTPYPVTLTVSNGVATWTVSSADTAKVGIGQIELDYYVNDIIKKSKIFKIIIQKSLYVGETPSDPYQDWLDEVIIAKTEAEQAVVDAQTQVGLAQEQVVLAHQEVINAQGKVDDAQNYANLAYQYAQESKDYEYKFLDPMSDGNVQIMKGGNV